MGIKKWKMPVENKSRTEKIINELGFPHIVAQVLSARGYTEQTAYFQEDSELLSPFLMKDMDKAVQRMIAAVEEGEMIAVYGDYDCDGITATCLLFSYLQDMGARAMYYIPDRDDEGYGLNCGAIDTLSENGVTLIVTVDNGISALEEVDYATEKGIDIIITDHHTPRETLPKAVAVVNPHRGDCTYPFKKLCGAGVVFKLICGIEGDVTCKEMLDNYGNILAVATVADIVELTGENRTIVKKGLQSIENKENLGLNALMSVGKLWSRQINSSSLAFGIAPRINAAGRMGQAKKAIELLLSEDEEEAESLAQEIDEYNEERKNLVIHIVEELEAKLAKHPEILQQRVLVLYGEGWHHGVIGIAASKLLERYSKPCILISIDGEEARGSARSVEGYSIIDAISRCSNLLTRYGGHPGAAGISLKSKDVQSWCKDLLEDAKQNFDVMPVNTIEVDVITTLVEMNLQTVEDLKSLEPYGMGNEMPILAFTGCMLEAITPMSEDKHIRLKLTQEKKPFTAVYFGMSSTAFPYFIGDKVDIVANLDKNEYNGSINLSIKIKDVHLNGLDQDKMVVGRQYYEKYKRGEELTTKIRRYITPTREDIALLYRYLKKQKSHPYGYDMLWCRLASLNYCKMMICVDVMQELDLIIINGEGENPVLSLPEQAGKVDLESSQILKSLKAGEDI